MFAETPGVLVEPGRGYRNYHIRPEVATWTANTGAYETSHILYLRPKLSSLQGALAAPVTMFLNKPCALFASGIILCPKRSRCRRDGIPLIESNCAVPRQI